MQRVCFPLQVRPERMEEYTERHAAVWPDMLGALHETGWHNYSLFLRDDGLLVGYVETPDLDAALAGMDATDVNARWQAEMAPFFEDLDAATRPGLPPAERGLPPRGPARRTTNPPRRTSHDQLHRDHRPPRAARHRGPVLGLRQLRHPLQGVRLPRHAPHRAGEDRRRRDRPRVHRTGADRGPAHPVGPGRRLQGAPERTPRTWASVSARSTPTRSRTTTTSSAA